VRGVVATLDFSFERQLRLRNRALLQIRQLGERVADVIDRHKLPVAVDHAQRIKRGAQFGSFQRLLPAGGAGGSTILLRRFGV
jgi:hypothetical protein